MTDRRFSVHGARCAGFFVSVLNLLSHKKIHSFKKPALSNGVELAEAGNEPRFGLIERRNGGSSFFVRKTGEIVERNVVELRDADRNIQRHLALAAFVTSVLSEVHIEPVGDLFLREIGVLSEIADTLIILHGFPFPDKKPPGTIINSILQ